MKIVFEVPLRLVAGSNAREHWGSLARRTEKQHKAGEVAMANALLQWRLKQGKGNDAIPFPLVVVITRRGKGKLDSDNLAISGKHLRDGIADALGIDDGDEDMVAWEYRQEHAPKFSARVEVSDAKCYTAFVTSLFQIQRRAITAITSRGEK